MKKQEKRSEPQEPMLARRCPSHLGGRARDDIRRQVDGERLFPLLGHMLAQGAREFRSRHPGLVMRNLQFARSAIPYLSAQGLIYLVEARCSIPTDLHPTFVRRAKQNGGSPIWFPTSELADRWITIWADLAPIYEDGCIVWPKQAPGLTD